MPHIARYQNRTVPRDSRSAAKSQDRAAPRVPCPATQHQERTVPRIPPRTTTTIANCAADFPPESLRQSQSDAEPPPRGQSVVASQPPASRKSGVASQVNLADKTGRRRGLHPPCLTDKADRRRGRASRLVAKKLTCPRANYLTNALSSANGIANQARGVEGGPQQFASATRKAKPEGSRPETPPNTTPQRTVK